MTQKLYDRDFLLWAEAQATALRSRGAGANALDYDNLAEEVEALGRAEQNTAASLTQRILEHLYKLDAASREEPKGHWRVEIATFRDDLERVLTRSIRARIEADLEGLHAKAARLAQLSMQANEPGIRVNSSRRWSLAQILGETNDPAGLDT